MSNTLPMPNSRRIEIYTKGLKHKIDGKWVLQNNPKAAKTSFQEISKATSQHLT